MASITQVFDRDREHIGWRAQVRRKGYPAQYQTFRTRREAEAWAAVVESEMTRGVFISRSESENTMLKDLLARYEREILPTKKSQQSVRSVISIINRHLGEYAVASITSTVLAKYRDTRLGTGLSSQTVRHEISLLSRVFNVAMKEWGMALPMGNPTLQIRMPAQSKARDRRLVGDEESLLLKACGEAKNPWLCPVVIFGIETAMRAGEMLETWKEKEGVRQKVSDGLLWKNVDMRRKVAHLPETKNGHARDVPLSRRALELLASLPKNMDGRVFGTTYEGIHQSYVRACRRAGIQDLRFHDLRHEATSRLFEKGLREMQVAAITGHRTLQMLKRYTHLRAEDLVELLG